MSTSRESPCICCAFVGVDNKLYNMHGTYITTSCTICTVRTLQQAVQYARYVHYNKLYNMHGTYITTNCTICTVRTLQQTVQYARYVHKIVNIFVTRGHFAPFILCNPHSSSGFSWDSLDALNSTPSRRCSYPQTQGVDAITGCEVLVTRSQDVSSGDRSWRHGAGSKHVLTTDR